MTRIEFRPHADAPGDRLGEPDLPCKVKVLPRDEPFRHEGALHEPS